MHLSGVRPSVCPSMGHSSKVCCCGPPGKRYRSISARRTAGRRANAGSATLSAYVADEHRLARAKCSYTMQYVWVQRRQSKLAVWGAVLSCDDGGRFGRGPSDRTPRGRPPTSPPTPGEHWFTNPDGPISWSRARWARACSEWTGEFHDAGRTAPLNSERWWPKCIHSHEPSNAQRDSGDLDPFTPRADNSQRQLQGGATHWRI